MSKPITRKFIPCEKYSDKYNIDTIQYLCEEIKLCEEKLNVARGRLNEFALIAIDKGCELGEALATYRQSVIVNDLLNQLDILKEKLEKRENNTLRYEICIDGDF